MKYFGDGKSGLRHDLISASGYLKSLQHHLEKILYKNVVDMNWPYLKCSVLNIFLSSFRGGEYTCSFITENAYSICTE